VSRNQGASPYATKKKGNASSRQTHGQYKSTAGNANASLSSNVTHNNHSHDSAVKKPRISPTASSVARNSNHEMTGTNNSSSRRASTSTHNPHNANSPVAGSAASADVASSMDAESGAADIKILSVATVNPDYETQQNDVIEILDYEDDDRGDNEIDGTQRLIQKEMTFNFNRNSKTEIMFLTFTFCLLVF